MDKRILITIALCWLAAGSLFAYKMMAGSSLVRPTFKVSSTEAGVEEAVTFTDYTEGASSWKWDFGDGEYGTSKEVTHKYLDAGRYTVSLTVHGDFGRAAYLKDASKTIIIRQDASPVDTATSAPPVREVAEPVTAPVVKVQKPAVAPRKYIPQVRREKDDKSTLPTLSGQKQEADQ